jgi:hypothetical protein
VEHHRYIDHRTLKEIKIKAKNHSAEMGVFILLLCELAARVQDVIGLKFYQILEAKKNKLKTRLKCRTAMPTTYKVELEGKKTMARTGYIS